MDFLKLLQFQSFLSWLFCSRRTWFDCPHLSSSWWTLESRSSLLWSLSSLRQDTQSSDDCLFLTWISEILLDVWRISKMLYQDGRLQKSCFEHSLLSSMDCLSSANDTHLMCICSSSRDAFEELHTSYCRNLKPSYRQNVQFQSALLKALLALLSDRAWTYTFRS